MTIGTELFGQDISQKEQFIETSYTGNTKDLAGTDGEAYYQIQDRQWFYRPFGFEKDDWYRVKATNLSCNDENGYIKCNYIGRNSHFPKTGKAFFSEEEGIWYYRSLSIKDLYRVPNESSLEFIRDKDKGGEFLGENI
jgi:hypothetical protein